MSEHIEMGMKSEAIGIKIAGTWFSTLLNQARALDMRVVLQEVLGF